MLHDATTLRNNRRRPGGESGARVVKEIPVPGAKPRGGGNKKKKTKKKHKGKLARKNSRKQRIADSTPSEPNPLAPTWGSAPRLGLAGFMRASRHPGTGGLGGLMEPDLPGPGAYTPKPYFVRKLLASHTLRLLLLLLLQLSSRQHSPPSPLPD